MIESGRQAIPAMDLSLFFDTSLDIMCIACSDGYFKKLNPSFIALTGYSENELLERPFVSFFHPDDVQKTQEEAQKLSEGILTVQFENRIGCKDGTYKLISWKCTPVGPLFFATGRDISDRFKIEQALKESERRIRLILENAPINLFAFDSIGTITFSSGRALEKMGIVSEKIVGKNLFQLYHDRKDILALIEKALGGNRFTATVEMNSIILETSYAPIYDENGKLAKVIGVSVDVSESRRAALAEIELKANRAASEMENKFKETFEHAGVGIAHTTFEGKILLANQELCNIL